MFRMGRRRQAAAGVAARLAAFLADTSAQDLLEYALLSALVGIIALAVLNALGVQLGGMYSAWNAAINGLWESPSH